MNNLTGHEKLKRDCVAYFRQNEIWQRIFTGFREKYSSYGRFSGKVTVKNISGDGLDEYYGAAEPPVRCGESHLSGLTEPLRSL